MPITTTERDAISAVASALATERAMKASAKASTCAVTFASLTMVLSIKASSPRAQLTSKAYVTELAKASGMTEGSSKVYLARGSKAWKLASYWQLVQAEGDSPARVEIKEEGTWKAYAGSWQAFVTRLEKVSGTAPKAKVEPEATEPEATEPEATDPIEAFGTIIGEAKVALLAMDASQRQDAIQILATFLGDFQLTVN